MRRNGWLRSTVRCLALVLWVAVIGPDRASAQRGATTDDVSSDIESDAAPGSHLQVFLMTIGPGDLIYERFSHNALVIRDDRDQTEVAYNWGIFNFTDADFIPRLARGQMRYSMRGFPASAWLEVYQRANRDVWLQPVNLTPGERLELQAIVREMDTEATRHYRYDYYRDNCSTRVRDVLDRVLGGRIQSATEGTDTGTTYRWHTARLLGGSPAGYAGYAGIQFVVGNRGDEPISAWEEMFLPIRLKQHLEGIQIVDAEGDRRPLLGEAVHSVEAVRDPIPQEAPDFFFPMLVLGAFLGALFARLGWAAGNGSRWGRWALTLSGVAWSAGVGLLGTALLLSWFFTDHVFWGLNENAFQANPLSLALAGALVLAELKRNGPGTGAWAWIRAERLGKVVGGVALLGFCVQLIPGFDQVNGEVMAVMLPAHLGLAWGTIRAWPPSMA